MSFYAGLYWWSTTNNVIERIFRSFFFCFSFLFVSVGNCVDLCIGQHAVVRFDVWWFSDEFGRRDERHCTHHLQFFQCIQLCRSGDQHIVSQIFDSQRRRGRCVHLLFGKCDDHFCVVRRTITIRIQHFARYWLRFDDSGCVHHIQCILCHATSTDDEHSANVDWSGRHGLSHRSSISYGKVWFPGLDGCVGCNKWACDIRYACHASR